MFPDSERFTELELLGSGVLGEVYRAEDTAGEVVVAIKVLRAVPPWAMYRLQSEFSSLQALSHHNLGRFFELHDAAEPWFITMAHIEGVPIAGWLAAHPATLREVFGQLTRALIALHDQKIIHRNIKPGNILVEADGRVRLLEGGLAGLLFDPQATEDTPDSRYQAPEARDDPTTLTPAADWYSLGVLLREQLSESGGALGALCEALTHPDPSFRPDGIAILSALAAVPRWPPRAPAEAPLVGRQDALDALSESLARCSEGPSIALLVGPSGVGKSALAAHFLDTADAAVLSVRCRPAEQAPFGVLNALVAALRIDLVSVEDLSPALPRMFPGLKGALPALPDTPLPPDPRAVRFQALDDLRVLLSAMTAERPMILFIDDLHLADATSARVLADLVTEVDAPRVLILGCCPADRIGGDFLKSWSELRCQAEPAGWFRLVPVWPLADDDMRALLSHLGLSDDAHLSDIVAAAHGSPLFARCLLHTGQTWERPLPRLTLRQVLTRHLSALPAKSRQLLDVLAAARQPLDPVLLTGILGEDPEASLVPLEAAGFIVRTPEIAFSHTELREAVLARAAPGLYHRSLAQALMEAEEDPIRICWHLLAADAPGEAIPHAITAADRAAATLQLEAAGHFYQLALAHLSSEDARRKRVVAACAAVLVRLGRAREAAPLLEEIAESRGDEGWQRRAAEQWIAAGEHSRGTAMLQGLLERAGIRWPTGRTEQGLLMRIGLTRLRLQTLPEGWESTPPEPAIQHRISLCRTAAQTLWCVDPGRAQYLLMSGLQLALRAKDPRQAARAGLLLYTFRGGMEERLRACQALAARIDQPELRALVVWTEAATLHAGRPAESIPRYQSAIEQFERECPEATWESRQARVGLLDALWWSGDVDAIRAGWRDSFKRARHIKDQPLWCAAALCAGRLALLEDRLDHARERIDQITARAGTPAAHLHARLLRVRCALYASRLDGLGGEIEAIEADLAASELHLLPDLHLHALDLRAATIAALLRAHSRGEVPAQSPAPRTLQRAAARIIRTLQRSPRPDMQALASLHRGSLAAIAGESAAARAAFTEAHARLAALSIPLYAALCTAGIARLGGEADSEALHAAGAADADAILRAHLPGV